MSPLGDIARKKEYDFGATSPNGDVAQMAEMKSQCPLQETLLRKKSKIAMSPLGDIAWKIFNDFF
jgi:hypothetical protein